MVIPMLIVLLLGIRSIIARLLIFVFIAATGYFSTLSLINSFRIETMGDILLRADTITTGFAKTEGGSTQAINYDFSSMSGLVSFLPFAAFTALFRPFPGEVMNPFGLLAGLENGILLYLLVIAIKRTKLVELKEPFILWAITFVIFWALVHGPISSSNFGMAERYKLQVLPILLGLLIYLARKREKAVPYVEAQEKST